jgi:hypothetical protein
MKYVCWCELKRVVSRQNSVASSTGRIMPLERISERLNAFAQTLYTAFLYRENAPNILKYASLDTRSARQNACFRTGILKTAISSGGVSDNEILPPVEDSSDNEMLPPVEDSSVSIDFLLTTDDCVLTTNFCTLPTHRFSK